MFVSTLKTESRSELDGRSRLGMSSEYKHDQQETTREYFTVLISHFTHHLHVNTSD